MKLNIFAIGGIFLSSWVITAAPTFAGLIENPSFEFNFNDEWPHYGPIDLWSGGSGVNEADGPFHNNGTPVPEGFRVAFLQGSSTLSQDIFDLVSGGQYAVQFFYDARGCCGGTINLDTQIDGELLDRILNVSPVSDGNPYKFRSVPFTAASDFVSLGLATTAEGDATVLLDGISIVPWSEGQIPVMNASFEASGTPDGTGLMEFLAGWEGVGDFGVNKSGQNFADNGTPTDQDHVGFISGEGSLTQNIPNLIDEETYELTFSVNAGDEGTAHLVVTAGATTILDEDLDPVGGDEPYVTKTIEFAADGDSVEIKFAQTNPGAVLLLDNIKLSGTTGEVIPPLQIGPADTLLAPGQKGEITITVPAAKIAKGATSITVRSPRPEIVDIVDGDFDTGLTIEFTGDGTEDVTATFEVEAFDRGRVLLEVTDTAGLDIITSATINVVTSLIRNGSFEAGALPEGVGYGNVLAWEGTGGIGINNAGMPFLDNGIVPDRKRVALLQGVATLSQEVADLTVGESYWLQFYYNARNCCEGGTIDLAVALGEQELATLTEIEPVGPDEPFHFINIPFTADGTAAVLQFTTTPTGDATVLLDAITIVPRPANDIVVRNPSFEVSAPASGVGYLQPDPIAGWEMMGGYGVNGDGLGPFTDNGLSEAGESVLFIQNAGQASQLIEGLTPGATYTLSYKVNRRACCSPDIPNLYEVTIDDDPVFDEELDAAGAGSPFWERSIDFTAEFSSALITFINMPDGDQTLLLDDVRIILKGGVVTPSFDVPIDISVIAGNTIRIAWPLAAPDALLEYSTDLATWKPVEALPFVDAQELVVADVITEPVRYYRLIED
ncbi:MAG: hypothetical protein R3F19_33600 [Verrucomicrobiales bacterium]